METLYEEKDSKAERRKKTIDYLKTRYQKIREQGLCYGCKKPSDRAYCPECASARLKKKNKLFEKIQDKRGK